MPSSSPAGWRHFPDPGPYLQDLWATCRGTGPVSFAWGWPSALRRQFGRGRQLEGWTGDGASFARYASRSGPLFLKYLPAGGRDLRPFRRLRREITYLRDFAPQVDVPHAPLLHAALDGSRRRAHLLIPDLTEKTWGWGHFQDGGEHERGLQDVARLLAHLHAAWAGHPALSGAWTWQPAKVAAQAAAFAGTYAGPFADEVRGAGTGLAADLEAAPCWTLVHGDIHSGQVLWPRDGAPPRLIDYGQVHPGLPGEDLAHLLGVRLNAAERGRYGAEIRGVYWAELARRGLHLHPAARAAQERAGVALNLLSTARQAAREPGEGVSTALGNVAVAWRELP